MDHPRIQQAIDLALQHHRAGRLPEAEQLYGQILSQQPEHLEALRYLGVLAHQQGRYDVAIDLARKVATLSPNLPEAQHNLGLSLKEIGQLDQAIAAYRKAIALRPNYPTAFCNLGIALQLKGQLDEAIGSYRSAISFNPRYLGAYSSLGYALNEAGRFDEAVAVFRQVIALNPSLPESHNNLGNALSDTTHLDDAIAAYQQAITLRPNYVEAYANLGNVLMKNEQLDEAIVAFRKVIALRPNYAPVYCSLGNALKGKDQLNDAIAAYRKAIALDPRFEDALINLGGVLNDAGRLDEALIVFRQAIALNPISADAHSNLGIVLNRLDRVDESISAFQRAIAINPDFAEAHRGLGSALNDIGQMDLAISSFRKAIALRPGHAQAHSSLLLALHYPPGIDATTIADEHRQWNQQHAEPLKGSIRPHTNDRDPERRLRIGYVSPDFREHAVARFLLPLLANHDHQSFEVFAYAQVRLPDAMTQRFRKHADVWRSLVGLSDAQAADLIRRDQIDILVDLAGHTSDNRLFVFAHKPAPVQVTYLGYPDTTGMDTIDYRLTDGYADPPGLTERYHSERLIRLDPCAWCFSASAGPPLPDRPDGPITLGSFNTFAKVTDTMLQLWSRILLAVPDSHLLLKSAGLGSVTLRQEVVHRLGELGIVPTRLELRGREPGYNNHLALYQRMDIALDTFPYHGTTTTCEALWMGVPVVSLAGSTHVSRVGVSLLNNVGLPDLVASNPEEYVHLAVQLANDRPRLKELHSTLHQRVERSPLMDARRFARNVESSYRRIWCSYIEADGKAGPP